MKKTKSENLLAGSTSTVRAGMESLPVMKHGEEPPDILLALLNSPLQTMLINNQARILGSGRMRDGRVGTILMIYGAQPTQNGLLAIPQSK